MAFLSLPGLCTGDLWHTAAAALLLRQSRGPFPTDIQYVVLLTLPEDAQPAIVTGRVSTMYNYLTNLGIPCVVAKLPAAGPSADDEYCERAAARISPGTLGGLVHHSTQVLGSGETTSFQAVWASLRPLQLPLNHHDENSPDINGDGGGAHHHPYMILPPIHHYAATPILATYFSRQSHINETHSYLAHSMAGVSDDLIISSTGTTTTTTTTTPPVSYIEDARQKVQTLRQLIATKRKAAGPGFEEAQAILFIYRAIDAGPQERNNGSSISSSGNNESSSLFVMNPHQNATQDLFDQVRRAALRHGLVTIRVPHGLPAESISPCDDLDLFDVVRDSGGGGDCRPALKDKRFTAEFWRETHCSVPDVFGAVGSRSGSLDIAAFMGVNCCEWDEPLLHEIQQCQQQRGSGNHGIVNRGLSSDDHLRQQVPQHLRLLTQRSFMSIGLLDGESFVPGRGYIKLDEKLLGRWLAGERRVFPSQIPGYEDDYVGSNSATTSRTFQTAFEKYFERGDIGLDAGLVRKLLLGL